jgi:hypothetical protein
MTPHKKAMTIAGVAAAAVFAFATILLTDLDFWERIVCFGIMGFFVGVCCFAYGTQRR